MLVHYWFVLETLLVKITGRHGQVLFIYDFIIRNKTVHSFLKVSFSDHFKIYSTVFIICALILSISSRFDYRFNSAIMTKALISHAVSCPDVIKSEKCPFRSFSGPHFLASVFKIESRKTPNTDTFHAVIIIAASDICCWLLLGFFIASLQLCAYNGIGIVSCILTDINNKIVSCNLNLVPIR